MTDAGPLLVPIRLDAAVNVRLTSAATTIRRWTMNYTQAASLGNVEPAPIVRPLTTTDEANQGVYLMWTLPAALRHGVQSDPTSGEILFPPTPNRWLVVRVAVLKGGSPTTAAWIVESDFLSDDKKNATSPYLIDKPTYVGRKIPLTGQPWAETNPAKTFLTAVAPGNPAFAAFQPANENVFSIHDEPADLPSPAMLHYFVAGWHAHPEDDPLRAARQSEAKGYAQLLESLRWIAPDPETKTATGTLYHGLLLGVKWDVQADPPPKPAHGDPQVALGATAADALTAFLKAHDVDSSAADLLEAFALDLLEVLEQPGGDAIFRRRLHESRFASGAGGIQWQIVDRASQPGEQAPPPPTGAVLTAEQALLAKLNEAQADLDRNGRHLASLQHELYELWWKERWAQRQSVVGDMPYGTTDEDFAKQLDPTSATSLAGQVKALLEPPSQPSDLPAPTSDVPGPTPDEYASKHELPSTRQLVAGLAPRFFTAHDPVLLVSGLGHDLEIDPEATLDCRYADAVLTAAGAKAPAIAAKGLPPLDPLLAEFVLLQVLYEPDQEAFAAAVAEKAGDRTPPDLAQAMWKQPWLPLYLEWDVAWQDLTYVDGKGTVQWTFNGRDFVFSGTPPTSGLASGAPTGRALLTPSLAYAVGSRLDALAGGDPESDALRKLRDTVKGWDFLSQTLDGLTLQLAKRDPSPAPAADGEIGKLLAGQHPPTPHPEQETAPHGDDEPTSTFTGLRAGQFGLTQVVIVDRFGQSLDVSHDLLKAAPGLTPHQPAPGACAELPPRLFQGARLRFTPVDEKGRTDVLAGANPILGFLVPDHVGRALAAHDAAGARLGELRVVATVGGARRVMWDPEPLRAYPTLEALTQGHPRLGAVLTSLNRAGAFQNFLTAIDESLWTIDPLSGDQDDYLTALAGRPLALVRARLAFELAADPIRDPDWPFTFAPVDPPFLHYDFPVKLGAAVDREDGLVGYFVGKTAKPFRAVHMPGRTDRVKDPSQFVRASTVQDFHLRFDGTTSADVTLLVDPRARVYARTGVLPATPLELPAAYLSPALAAISIAYRAGPLLADSPGAPLMPTPTASGRTWSWVEQGRNGPTPSVPFPAADDRARFSPVPATAREGFVQVDPPTQEVDP